MNHLLSLTLTIDNPCAENWEAMEQNGTTRYCQSCQKAVYDFADFSDSQLLAFFREQPGSICGRIRHNNLRIDADRKLPAAHRHNALAPLAATLLTLSTFAVHAGAAPASWKPGLPVQTALKRAATGSLPDTIIISGTITNRVGHPLANAEIRCDSSTLWTNEKGYFELKLSGQQAKPLLLQFSWGKLVRQVRNFHPVMGSTHFDIVLEERTECEVTGGVGGDIVMAYRLPDSLSILSWKTNEKLDAKRKNQLNELAATLRNYPGIQLRIIANYRSDGARAKKQVDAVIEYLVEKQGISRDRFQTEAPTQYKDGKWALQIEFMSIGR